MLIPASFSRIAEEALGFLLSSSCAGCEAPAAQLCDACRASLVTRIAHRQLRSGTPVVAAVEFEGVAARAIRQLKEQGRTALARPLATLLAGALQGSGVGSEATLVPVPTSRAAFRRRGFRVPELLLRRAGLRPRRLLLPARAARDQRELSLEERALNVRGTMRPTTRAALRRDVVLVDDVMTTGATLEEAARMLRAAGFGVAAAVVLASTPRRVL